MIAGMTQSPRERITDFEASLKHARVVCDQIQTGGDKCAAVEPEQMM
jgi:hypothetical protein